MATPLPATERHRAGSTLTEVATDHRQPPSLLGFRQLSALHEADRHTVARALHDQIGQAVSAIKMSAHLSLDESDASQRREDLLEIIRIADDTVGRLRDLCLLLRPPQLETLGLEAALRGEIERALAGTSVSMEQDIPALPRRPEPEIELACLRIAQHALGHALGPGQASRLWLSLRDNDGDSLSLRFEHEGNGVNSTDPDEIATAQLMREHALAVGGSLHLHLGGMRTCLDLRLPYTVQAV